MIYFIEDPSGAAKRIICQIKRGRGTVREMRELLGVVNRTGAEMGAMITIDDPTEPARQKAITAGSYVAQLTGMRVPKLHSVTAADLLAGSASRYLGGLC